MSGWFSEQDYHCSGKQVPQWDVGSDFLDTTALKEQTELHCNESFCSGMEWKREKKKMFHVIILCKLCTKWCKMMLSPIC